MKKGKFSPTTTMLLVVLILVAVTVFLNHKKDRDLIALNESKSKLTDDSNAIKKSSLKELIKKNLSKQMDAGEAQIGAGNVLTLERIYTEAEINQMSEEKFSELLSATEKKLPTKLELKQLPAGALHRTPPIVIQAGRDLGVIKEVLKIHETYENVALPFYKNCAKNEAGVTPVRALCLTNLIEIKKKNGQPLNLKEYPNQLVELSKMVTEI